MHQKLEDQILQKEIVDGALAVKIKEKIIEFFQKYELLRKNTYSKKLKKKTFAKSITNLPKYFRIR